MNPILQFGTSRFLLAHADLLISEALERGEALGKITIVQTTDNPESARRIASLALEQSYPIRIRGLTAGEVVDRELLGAAIGTALFAGRDWPAVRQAAMAAKVIISNTGDRGFDLDDADTRESIADRSTAPRSFPAKIAALLLERCEAVPENSVSILPCELVQRNGDRLREIVTRIARDWGFPKNFFDYLDQQCCFANSIVDRIVSESISPVGAVAEPYVLWAIENHDALTLPCVHPAIVLTDHLDKYEQLKLHILNLGHTYLADVWLMSGHAGNETVRDFMTDNEVRAALEEVWHKEVLPVFVAAGMASEAAEYIDQVRDRFLNPFLAHRLADIANNHVEKKQRRIHPIVKTGRALGIAQPRLLRVLETTENQCC